MLKVFRKYKTGLVLSGGGARAIAHLGVLQYFIEKDFSPSIISGVSGGAIVGAFLSEGYKPIEVLNIISSKKLNSIMKLTYPRTGFFKLDGMKSFLEENLKTKNIEDMPVPLIIAATNINKGKIEYITQGNLVETLIASSAIPILFHAVKLNGDYYFDGGVMDNLPIKPIRNECKKIIAVHANPQSEVDKVGSPVRVGERAFHLAIASEITNKKEIADLFIEPPGLNKYSILDIKKAHEMFDLAYNYTKQILEK